MRYKNLLLFLLLLIILIPPQLVAESVEKYETQLDTYILYDDFYDIYQDGIKFTLNHKKYETFRSINSLYFEVEGKHQNGSLIDSDFWHKEVLSFQHRKVISSKVKMRLRTEITNDYNYDILFRNYSLVNSATLYYYYNLFFYLKLEYHFEIQKYKESQIVDNFTHQVLFKILKRSSILNSYYFMLLLEEKNLPDWPLQTLTTASTRRDNGVTVVFSTLNSVSKIILNEFLFQLEFYSSNINAYELVNLGPVPIIELPNETSDNRKLVSDYFNYYSRKFTNNSTFILPKNYSIQLSISYLLKDYQSKNARNKLGVIKNTREWDEQITYSVNMMKSKMFKERLSLKLGVIYQVNNSNNKYNQYYLYDGERYLFSLGATWKFN